MFQALCLEFYLCYFIFFFPIYSEKLRHRIVKYDFQGHKPVSGRAKVWDQVWFKSVYQNVSLCLRLESQKNSKCRTDEWKQKNERGYGLIGESLTIAMRLGSNPKFSLSVCVTSS